MDVNSNFLQNPNLFIFLFQNKRLFVVSNPIGNFITGSLTGTGYGGPSGSGVLGPSGTGTVILFNFFFSLII